MEHPSDDSNAPLSPPKVVNDFSNQYLKKAVELFDNKTYDGAQQIVETILMLTPNDKAALNLQEKISNLQSRIAPQIKPIAPSNVTDDNEDEPGQIFNQNDDSKEEKKSDENHVVDHCQNEFIRFLEDRVKMHKFYPDLYARFEKA
eukprot:355956_1